MAIRYDLAIINGTIVTPTETYAGDILVNDGKIACIMLSGGEYEADEIYDATGKYVFAGFIDTHVHSRDGGAPQKEDFLHSTISAACGGITTLLEMPNAIPAVATVDNFYAQRENLSSKAYIDFAMWALCIGDQNNDQLEALAAEGVIGFKFFWGYSIRKDNYNLIYNPKADDDNIIPPPTDGQVLRIFRTVARTGKEIAVHAENSSIIKELTREIDPADYENEYEALLAQRPILAEVACSEMAILFAEATGAHLHILHVSAKDTIDLVRRAKAKGIHVTAETCPHYLLLTNKRYNDVGNMMKCYPPVRYSEDQDALWDGLKDGTLNHICSDHAPHTIEDKTGPLAEIPAGMCSIETMVPLIATEVGNGRLTVNQLAAFLSENPAKQYHLYPQKGSLEIGTDADITVLDFNADDVVHADRLHSVSKVTAFENFPLKVKASAVFLRGIKIAENGEPVLDHPTGQFVRV